MHTIQICNPIFKGIYPKNTATEQGVVMYTYDPSRRISSSRLAWAT